MQNIVITGANRGIGLELAKIYSKTNNVFALCRNSSNELIKLKNTHIITNCELTDLKSAHQAIEKCPGQIDILINNAGVLASTSFNNLLEDKITIEAQIQINAIAPIMFSRLAYPKLTNGSKIALITSRMGSISDNQSGSSYGYRMSKAALNAAGKSLAIDLKAEGISVGILHPGWVKTNMTNYSGNITADIAAEQLTERISNLNLENSGSFWHANGEDLEW
ncbi:MAG: SDR family oxidoreductase [Rickettsiales bacterium]|nr:SDR family oxidoreductase [Rickettsiales bacterium]